jgi:hypothetical protein
MKSEKSVTPSWRVRRIFLDAATETTRGRTAVIPIYTAVIPIYTALIVIF